MHRFRFLAGVAVFSVASLHATVISCSYNLGTSTGGAAPVSGCYSSSAIFGANDSLDWGTALGEAFTSTTSTGEANPHGSPWNATTTGGFGVAASLGPNAQFSTISRVDNTLDAWSQTHWDFAGNVSSTEYGKSILTFGGHFETPPLNDPPFQFDNSPYQFGAHLLATTDGSGDVAGGGKMILSFSSPIQSIGFRISAASNSDNSDFNATVIAKDASGATVGSYSIQDQGDGGGCAALLPVDQNHNPGNCDNAPWVGFIDPTGSIKSISIEAFNTSNADVGFLIDSLALNTAAVEQTGPAPEPGVTILVALGLVTLAAKSRKRSRRLAG